MTYRLSIIISLLLLGMVMLYLRKKEGWEWDKVVLFFSVTVLTITICASIGIFIYIKMSAKPEIQTSFWDVNLESRKPSIEFIKGPPIEVTDDGYWIYQSKVKGDAEIYFLKFMNEKLWVVGYLRGGLNGGPGIQGLKQGSSVDDIAKYFGEPSQVIEIKVNLSSLHLYEKYNVFFVVKRNKISFYGVYNSNIGPFTIKETFSEQLSEIGVD